MKTFSHVAVVLAAADEEKTRQSSHREKTKARAIAYRQRNRREGFSKKALIRTRASATSDPCRSKGLLSPGEEMGHHGLSAIWVRRGRGTTTIDPFVLPRPAPRFLTGVYTNSRVEVSGQQRQRLDRRRSRTATCERSVPPSPRSRRVPWPWQRRPASTCAWARDGLRR